MTRNSISGYEEFQGELRLLYFASLTPGTGTLHALRMVPVRAWKMRLRHASAADSRWTAAMLSWISRGFGSKIEHQPDGTLLLRPAVGHLGLANRDPTPRR
jgi:poly-gamma-glutamate synthesis protein (capsule biosynthesis protein)